MQEALKKLVANFLLWLIFILSFVVYYAIKNDLGINGVIPNSELYKYLNYEVLFIQIISAFILFGLFSLVTHKSKTKKDISNGKHFMDLALSEWASVLFNFGSLCLSVSALTQNWWLLIVVMILYGFGLLVYPKGTALTRHRSNRTINDAA